MDGASRKNKNHFQQQVDESLGQSHVGSVPVRAPLIMPAAHPTPAWTVMASAGQFWLQAPHSMHRFLSVITAFLFFIWNTRCGQTIVHILQPIHFSISNASVVTFSR